MSTAQGEGRLAAGSFRDPFGKIFIQDGEVYRCIFDPGLKEYTEARDAGIYDKLIDAGLLLPHQEVEIPEFAPDGTVICLQHPKMPMISYPWEWPFSLLKDAALIHLDIMQMILPHGFCLRDASAFNAQFDGERVILVDTLSIGRRIPESPWVAYGQFCSHFLAPLAMAAFRDVRMLSLFSNYIDGLPLDLAAGVLPFWKRVRPGLLMHLILHARAQGMADRKKDIGKARPGKRKPKISDSSLMGIVRSLRKTIEGISWKRSSRIWEEYGDIRTYRPEDVAAKSDYVEKVVRRLEPEMVWDLGANTGEFSLIAASQGAFVVSIEGDPACTEHLYQHLRSAPGGKRVLPLTMDLASPSPAVGWANRERLSLNERGPADLVLALALTHHLVFSACVPLHLIAEWFRSIGDNLLVEFVPPDDPMVQKLLATRTDEHHPYSLDEFKIGFGEFFDFTDQVTLKNGRMLFLCRGKPVADAMDGF